MYITKRCKAFLVIIGLTFIFTSDAYCHENTLKGGRGYITFESNRMDVGELNADLKHKGYSVIPENHYGIGFGGYSFTKNNILWDGYASLYFPRSNNSTIGDVRYTTSLNGFYGIYNIGYHVWSKNGLTIFPLAGIGIGGLWLKIKEGEKHSFETILENPPESTKETAIETKGIFIFNFAVGIEKSFCYKEEKGVDRLLMTGIRLGFRYCPGEHGWYDVSGGPDISFTGPYFLFLFGGGYSKK